MVGIFYHSGDTIEVKAPRLTLIFTKAEWKRVALALDEKMNFPAFS